MSKLQKRGGAGGLTAAGEGDRLRMSMLSTLWVFLSVNYLFCDILSGMEQASVAGYLAGSLNGIEVTQSFLLAAGISLEIPFLMIVLSRVLGFRANKAANIAAASLMIVYQAGSFFVGSSSLHYIFFSAVEIAGNLAILLYAISWKRPGNASAQSDQQSQTTETQRHRG